MAAIGTAKARKYVLSIDGGGFRGYTCLVQLHHLMRQLTSNPADSIPLPCHVFDVICGTSTGGLIAILLGRLGLDCLTAMSVYKELVTALFTDVDQKATDNIVGDEGLFPGMFEEKLSTIVEKYTGNKDTPMKTHKTRPDTVNHTSTDTFVTVVQSTAGAAGVEPYRVRSYTTPRGGIESVPDRHWTICEVVRAAVALPGYFKPVDIGSQSFQDAVLSGSANPVQEAISEIELRWSQDFEPLIISLGTGLVSLSSFDSDDELSEEDHAPAPLVAGSQRPRGIFWSDAFLKQLQGVARDTELAHQGAMKHFRNMNLARNYFRFDPTGGLGDLRSSDVSQVPRITALTNVWLRTPEGSEETSRASRVLKERLDENRARAELQHSEVNSHPDSDTESSGVPEAQGRRTSVPQSNISSPERQLNELRELEEDPDPDNELESSGVPEGGPSVAQGDISSPEQQHRDKSCAHPTERPPPTANDSFSPVLKGKGSWVNALKKRFPSRQNNHPAREADKVQWITHRMKQAEPTFLKRAFRNLGFLERNSDACEDGLSFLSAHSSIDSLARKADALQKAGHNSHPQ
ncbi:acyl transferase/acyl hydrolase/lysophospholipase [Boletus coccyginus]|nr:acyl transferase/acyl hydrolase/lysophospholipase [Boletus coccyginus]